MFVDQHLANLAEANRIASQSVEDRLEGLQGEEAERVITRLLADAGMTHLDAGKLLSAFGWQSWRNGWDAASATGKKDS